MNTAVSAALSVGKVQVVTAILVVSTFLPTGNTHRISSGGRTGTARGLQTSSWSPVWPGCSWSPWCHSSESGGRSPLLVNLRIVPAKK